MTEKKHRVVCGATIDPVNQSGEYSLANKKARAKSSYRKKHQTHNNKASFQSPKKEGESMEQKVCGIDVHRDTLVTTILDNTGQKQTQTFQNSLIDMEQLKNHLRTHNCQNVVMESTGSYWTTLYAILEDAGLKPVLANAYQVKAIPGRKNRSKRLRMASIPTTK